MRLPCITSVALFLLLGLLIVMPVMAGCGGQSSVTSLPTPTPKASDIARKYAETVFDQYYALDKWGQEQGQVAYNEYIEGLYNPLNILADLLKVGAYNDAATLIKEFAAGVSIANAYNYNQLMFQSGLTYDLKAGFEELAELIDSGADFSNNAAKLRSELSKLNDDWIDSYSFDKLQGTDGMKQQAKTYTKKAVQSAIAFLDGLSKVPMVESPTPVLAPTKGSTVFESWVAQYDCHSMDTGAEDLAVDDLGNVYVTGICYSPGRPDSCYRTIKYDEDGNQLWARNYDPSSTDHAYAMTLDGLGNVYVTGDSGTVKYDSEGNQIWSAEVDAIPNVGDGSRLYDIEEDGVGNLVVIGTYFVYRQEGRGQGYIIIKYDTNGNEIWKHVYAHSTELTLLKPTRVNLDRYGNVYASVEITDLWCIVKYAVNGDILWKQQLDWFPYDMVMDASGNIYVTGRVQRDSADYITSKYSSDGSRLWVAYYDYPKYLSKYQTDMAKAITVDKLGNVYVTGRSQSEHEGDEYATIKYDTNGNQMWVARYNGSAHAWDEAIDVAVDDSGNVYVAGRSSHGDYSDSADYVVVKYDSEGSQIWSARYNSGNDDTPVALAVDKIGNVFVTGSSHFGYITIKNIQMLNQQPLNPTSVVGTYVETPIPNSYIELRKDGTCRLHFSGSTQECNWVIDGPVIVLLSEGATLVRLKLEGDTLVNYAGRKWVRK